MNKPKPVSYWFARILPVAGLILLALVGWRLQQLEHWRQHPESVNLQRRALAPRFELADHRRHLVKFERFLGRQRVVLIFFDAELGADRDPRLQPLLDKEQLLKANGIEVVAVSSATPYANKQAEERLGESIGFPLLTDIDVNTPIPDPVHRMWGRYDEGQDQTLTGLFLIGRDGTVAVDDQGRPKPVENEQQVLELLSQGRWPEP